jgi:hypothetical protein
MSAEISNEISSMSARADALGALPGARAGEAHPTMATARKTKGAKRTS